MERISRLVRRTKPQLYLVTLLIRSFVFIYLEEIRVWIRYGRFIRFMGADLFLRSLYFFENPYKLHRKVFGQGGYGETPLTSLDIISRRCRILSNDSVIDLRCGRGRSVLWWGSVVGCSSKGVDLVPRFIKNARKVLSLFQFKTISFYQGDLLTIDFKEPSVFFLASTCFSDDLLNQIADRLRDVRSGIKIITVSTPLHRPYLRLVDQFQIRYPWGKATVFFHVRL